MRFCFLLLLIFSAGILFAQSSENYSRARVWTPGSSIQELAALGICVDHGHYRKGTYLECDFSTEEIDKMRQAGFTVDVLIEDVTAFYIQRSLEPADGQASNKASGCGATSVGNYLTPLGFNYGSMGGYFTYQEMLGHLDSMASQFPDLITSRQPIDTFLSHQGRPIYYLRMTSALNPSINKPQVLYTALHHSREPASLSQLIFYMYYLLENYGTDAEITYLLDNAELVFVPCINPDGYVRNQTTNPNGGGFWRKNRRQNPGGSFGVDLNRNYGYNWGYDDDGSSPDENDDTYRGPAGFSEPETQAIRFLCLNNDFKVAVNHHTYGNLLVYPWGYEAGLLTPDSTVFENLSKWMTQENGFVYGTGDQTVGYTTNGDSDDWMYGEQVLKPKIFSLTPESGSSDDGFWPAQSRIIPICIDNMHQNLTAARFVLNYGVADELTPSILPALSGTLSVSLTRMSLDASAPLTLSIEPISGNITSVSAPVVVNNLNSFESDTFAFAYTLAATAQPGEEVLFKLVVDNGVVATEDTLVKYLGPAQQIVADSADITVLWAGNWATTNQRFVSPPFSFTDSPNGDYRPSATNVFTLDTVVDLSAATFAQLRFAAQWAVEVGYDYAQVQARVGGTGPWQPLCGKYTKPGNSNQDQGQPIYDGFSNGWVQEEISLNDYLGDSIELRFRLVSDNFVEEDGFYFDDLEILAITQPVDTTDSITAIGNPIVEPTVALYPNPADDRVQIVVAGLQGADKLGIYNMLGQLAIELELSQPSGSYNIDLSVIESGVYLVKLSGSGGWQGKTLKLLVR